MFKFGRQRSTINILSNVGRKIEEETFHEIDEDQVIIEKSSEGDEGVGEGDEGVGEGESEIKSEVKMRCKERSPVLLKKLGRKRSNSVKEQATSLVLRGRDGRGAPLWMLERSASAYIKPW